MNSLNRFFVCFLFFFPFSHEQHPGHVSELLQFGWFVNEVVQAGPAGLDYGGLLHLGSVGPEKGAGQHGPPGETQSPQLLLVSSGEDYL